MKDGKAMEKMMETDETNENVYFSGHAPGRNRLGVTKPLKTVGFMGDIKKKFLVGLYTDLHPFLGHLLVSIYPITHKYPFVEHEY